MYRESFYITKPVWNNAFSFDKRTNKKLYVPSLIEIDDLDKIELQPHPNPLFHSNFEDSSASTPVSVILRGEGTKGRKFNNLPLISPLVLTEGNDKKKSLL